MKENTTKNYLLQFVQKSMKLGRTSMSYEKKLQEIEDKHLEIISQLTSEYDEGFISYIGFGLYHDQAVMERNLKIEELEIEYGQL